MPAVSPDELNAPALRRALTLERQKRQAVEQEQARLQGVIVRQNQRLAEWTEQQQAVRRQVQELLARVAALGAQNTALAGEVATLREENHPLRWVPGCAQRVVAGSSRGRPCGDRRPLSKPRPSSQQRPSSPAASGRPSTTVGGGGWRRSK